MKRTIVIFFLGIFLCLSIKALELDEPDLGITDFEEDENEGKTEDQLEESFEIFQRGAVYDAQSGKRRYDNYQVISVNPQTEEHLDVLQFLERGKKMIFFDRHELWNLSHCLKITQNVAYDFLNFGSFHQFLSYLVTLFDRKLQVFKNSPKWTIFGIFN